MVIAVAMLVTLTAIVLLSIQMKLMEMEDADE